MRVCRFIDDYYYCDSFSLFSSSSTTICHYRKYQPSDKRDVSQEYHPIVQLSTLTIDHIRQVCFIENFSTFVYYDFVANRSYSQNGLSQDLSVYEKGSGAEYMAAAGWTKPATDNRRTQPREQQQPSITFSKSTYNRRSRWLCTCVVIMALLLIILIIAIIVLLATRGLFE